MMQALELLRLMKSTSQDEVMFFKGIKPIALAVIELGLSESISK